MSGHGAAGDQFAVGAFGEKLLVKIIVGNIRKRIRPKRWVKLKWKNVKILLGRLGHYFIARNYLNIVAAFMLGLHRE